jgi:hypothetical protein
MKKGLIKEAFRLQQIAGIKPINEVGLQNEENGGYDFQPDVDKAAHMLAKDYMREEGIEDEDEALNYAAKEIIEYLEQMYTQYMEGVKPGLKAAYAERELDGDASRQMHEEASQGEDINLHHVGNLQGLPDEAADIMMNVSISNEDYITEVLGKSVDFNSEEAEEQGIGDYEEAFFDFYVEQGILSDSKILATIQIGGRYVDEVTLFDQGNGYVAITDDYTGMVGITTKQAADEAIKLMKTM